ncbi:tRNA uridine-5-carboxymethylaminomethyl(34) synthesis GTPase MnmE [Paracoccus aerodenitrificans]|uniref:tRNA uridine-5-carboxymethylaminomethyl(34) synthesis GTPase MnmE n=1 Tax=Paracoccus aerodenitrificans TaxID=3017781 RepID=UPI0022F09692|nr:tRNA uridine-5-carboxymethylaminomethyl(34) synthesis GTPase MnmE [Paracoccus aerodenitrificans]WBU63831.1 tRNA uridine-5-carboxymethylaminomethyl(34) synthesis GTPase MnmE [Paracoccus aerodenitrificans]
MSTIFAEATPAGRGGVSIIRLSGPESRRVAEELAGPLPRPREAYYRTAKDGSDLIDRCLVIRFDAGSSFTGEDSCEFQLHGAPVVVRRLEAALRDRGLRRADPGEFTLRAFLSGRLDLAQVEGLADLLEAETEDQRKLAAAASEGALGKLAEIWREDLILVGSLLTAAIDFADEEIPDDVTAEVDHILERTRLSISEQLSGFPASERLRIGFEVAIIGVPNAGKSSLMNVIAGRDIAIVTEQEGTTRDIVEFRADLKGLPVTFLDTAGIRESNDIVERLGIEKAAERAKGSDLRIFLGVVPDKALALAKDDDVFIDTRRDLTGDPSAVSGLTGEGVDQLLDRIHEVLRERVSRASLVSHSRQADAMQAALDALHVEDAADTEIIAEAVREAVHHLKRLVGKIDTEDYLDRVFSTFCIGK